MRGKILRRVLFGLAALVLLAGAFFGYASLVLAGWPNEHLSRPDFAAGISDKNWNDFATDADLDSQLTRALVLTVGNDPSVATLVAALDRQGFLAEQKDDGTCPSGQSSVDLWIRGCRSRPHDLAALTAAREGAMWYYWGGFACDLSIEVTWWSAAGRAKNIKAAYGATCL